jgi:hypothetical protein
MSFDIRTSERSTFKRCPQQWWWSYVEQIKPLRAKTPLWFGSAWHIGMAEWYQPGLTRGAHPAETFDKVLEGDRSMLVRNEEDEAVYDNAREVGIAMANHYVDTWGKDEHMYMLATERPFQVWIPHPHFVDKKRWVRYVGTIDGVYRDERTGEIWLLENKTAAALRVDHLPLDDQAGAYWALMKTRLIRMGVLNPGENIAGIMYNHARKAVVDDRPQNAQGLFLNKDGTVSKRQPPPYHLRTPVYRSVAERATQIHRIQDEALYMQAVKSGKMPVLKHVRYDCPSMCDYFKLCKMHESGSEAFEDFKEMEFTSWDPYADHNNRKSADG